MKNSWIEESRMWVHILIWRMEDTRWSEHGNNRLAAAITSLPSIPTPVPSFTTLQGRHNGVRLFIATPFAESGVLIPRNRPCRSSFESFRSFFFYGSSSPRRVRCPHGAHHEIQLNRTAIRRPTESIHPVVAARGNKTEVIPGAVGLYFRRRLFFFSCSSVVFGSFVVS